MRSKITITPLTVKQLEHATQSGPMDPWVVDGKELSHVRILGRMLDIQDELSFIRFLIHDGTGSMQFTYYYDNNSNSWNAKRSSMK